MSAAGLTQAQDVMRAAGVAGPAIDVFSHYYAQLEAGATGLILEDSIEPLVSPDSLDGVEVSDEAAREAFAKTAIIKLNGGLGTSMGMDRAKSLLPVRDGKSFLDLIVEQVRQARAATGARVPLILRASRAGTPIFLKRAVSCGAVQPALRYSTTLGSAPWLRSSSRAAREVPQAGLW